MVPWSRRSAPRKYIDLINEATFKRANWDPPLVIQIGDFGVIDKKTGELVTQGNIFTHPDIKHVTQDFPAYVAPETDLYQIHSQHVKRLDVNEGDGAASVANDQGVCSSSRWQFNNKRGALLLMHRPQLICVPDGFFHEKKFDLPLLKHKVVVDQVYNCPGFYMYMSNKCSEQISVSLRSNTLPPASPSDSTESTLFPLSVGWSANVTTGFCQYAYREDAVYTPIFHLKSMGRRH